MSGSFLLDEDGRRILNDDGKGILLDEDDSADCCCEEGGRIECNPITGPAENCDITSCMVSISGTAKCNPDSTLNTPDGNFLVPLELNPSSGGDGFTGSISIKSTVDPTGITSSFVTIDLRVNVSRTTFTVSGTDYCVFSLDAVIVTYASGTYWQTGAVTQPNDPDVGIYHYCPVEGKVFEKPGTPTCGFRQIYGGVATVTML